ncbi:MAG: 5-formyltetrahydrofolate cyclo-ligase, partial [Rhizobacter sp.]|nr:5-formyltetrahydrofolate cyclo-ligase [Rhizobacter sp.]
WQEGPSDSSQRRIGMTVVDRLVGELRFHVRYPGCEMEQDAYDIPKPKNTEVFAPTVLLIPCLGYGPGGLRLGYGGGFYDRTLASLTPRPFTVGIGYSHGFQPMLRAGPDDTQLDAMLTEDGVMWQRPD